MLSYCKSVEDKVSPGAEPGLKPSRTGPPLVLDCLIWYSAISKERLEEKIAASFN